MEIINTQNNILENIKIVNNILENIKHATYTGEHKTCNTTYWRT